MQQTTTFTVIWSLVLTVLIVAIYIVAKHQINKNSSGTYITKYRYAKKKTIMTPYEQRFFLILTEIFNQKCYIIPQVHLSKLLNHKIKGQNWRGAFSHINGKSVDFVLLRKSNLEPLCAIELDDWTHTLQNRQKRDYEVESIFQSAGLPLARFHNIDELSKQEIVDHITQVIRH